MKRRWLLILAVVLAVLSAPVMLLSAEAGPRPTQAAAPKPKPTKTPTPTPTPTPTQTVTPTPTPTPMATTASPSPTPTATTTSTTGSCVGVAVTPTSNVQSLIDANPSGTTFCFASGTYTTNVNALAPKAGDVFDGGNRGAILDGANTRQYAFKSSSAANVTIKGFVIKRYNTPLQAGAVHSFGATGWRIENNQITLNAAAAVATDSGARVINNLLDWNKQEGYAAHGSDILYEGNEIAFNNHDLAVDATWEAGGGKAWDTDGATFRNNNVHDNGGNGLWDDTNNIRITYDGNTVDNNWGAGIYHEIGYDAKIINNRVSRNGMPTSPGGGQKLGYAWDAGIQIRMSQSLDAANPLLIERNTVINNYNSITLIDSPADRGCSNAGEGRYGPCMVKNVLVKDNAITASQGAAAGAFNDIGGTETYSRNNHFTGNKYCVATAAHPDDGYAYGWFAWGNDWTDSFATWQGFGHDTTGSFQVGGTCTLP